MNALRSLFLKAAGMVLAAFVVFGAGYLWGYDSASDEASVATLKSQNAALASDLTIARNAEEKAKAEAAVNEKSNQQNEELVRELMADLSKRPPHAVCRLDDADARSLRNID